MNSIGNLHQKKILFLQGPMGGFFKNVDLEFRKRGARTYKIGFNTGDWVFSNKDNYIPYRGTIKNWTKFIYNFFKEHHIDMLFVFGDCRYYQSIAIEKSLKLGIAVYVFEEGYIRPDFITLERYGVNDFSKISRDPNFYFNLDTTQFSKKSIINTHPKYYCKVWSAALYYTLSALLYFRYPHYRHHRYFSFITEGFWGVRNLFRKYKYKIIERGLHGKVVEGYRDLYYFVPLQTYNDFQVMAHSNFSSIEIFIQQVMHSFAKYAPRNTFLIIKHHPEDRGRKDYRQYITILAEKLAIEERIIIIYDLDLPSCLKNAIGTITINSTVGISSLYHNTPTVVLGNAIYDIDGLTCKDMPLDDFWIHHRVPNKELFAIFKQFLIETTQLNGSFYGRFPDELSRNDHQDKNFNPYDL